MKTALPLRESFTSTGAKFFTHQEAMTRLRNGRGQPITTHIMSTDVCNHRCAFCSVQARAGEVLPLSDILGYLDILLKYNLKSVILSGGGNPILYKCPKTGADFDRLVYDIHSRGLEIGLITNGMPLKEYGVLGTVPHPKPGHTMLGFTGQRNSWKTVHPSTLDRLTWIRISMSGLDHAENEVYVPDIDPTKTTLGFSYVAHDEYCEPNDPHHGRVSRPEDFVTLGIDRAKDERIKPPRYFRDRMKVLTDQITFYVTKYNPRYVRLLPNCLEPSQIPERCDMLQRMADSIDPDVCFVQYKPPAAPNVCLLGYVHPVLNCDGYVYPCDSCVLNEAADHQFNKPWRVSHWSKIGEVYDAPVRSLVDPPELCPGCVFTGSNLLLEKVWKGETPTPPTPPSVMPEHANFI